MARVGKELLVQQVVGVGKELPVHQVVGTGAGSEAQLAGSKQELQEPQNWQVVAGIVRGVLVQVLVEREGVIGQEILVHQTKVGVVVN